MSRRLAMPVFACSFLKSKMVTPVVSLPVPAVVGIAMSGFSGPGHRQALADRRVHVVEKVGRRIGRVEVDRLRRVDRRAAADGDERVERPLVGERDRVEERLVARLDAHAVVERIRHAALLQRLEHGPDRRQLAEHRIGDDEHEARPHFGQVHADLARDADAEAHAGDGHLERDVFGHSPGCIPTGYIAAWTAYDRASRPPGCISRQVHRRVHRVADRAARACYRTDGGQVIMRRFRTRPLTPALPKTSPACSGSRSATAFRSRAVAAG